VKGVALALLAATLLAAPARAAGQGVGAGGLPDPAQEAHAHVLFRQIRCVVCQNESIDDSEAPLAADLRRLIREQVAAGRADADIRRFLVERYGQFVLLKPRFDLANAALWLGPFALLAAGLVVALASRRGVREANPLTTEEGERLALLRATAPEVTLAPRSRPQNGSPRV
jgi:cytochrome c-type biogenesis protein CcmH